MSTRTIPVVRHAALRMSGIALICFLWELVPRSGLVNPMFFPPLSAVLQEIAALLRDQHLFGHTVASLWRLMAGILLASLLAVPSGAILGYWLPGLTAGLNPLFRMLAQINPFSLMTVFLLFFGIGEKAKLIIVIWVAFWPLLHHVVNGVQNLDEDLLKAARSMGTPPGRLILQVILPGAAPSIFLGIRTTVVLLLAILVAGEMLGGLAGLGWLLHWSGNYYSSPYATTPVFAVGLCISLIGVALSAGLRKLERELLFWKPFESVWNATVPPLRRRSRPTRALAVTVTSAVVVLLIAGGVSTRHLSKTNGSFSGEGDVPSPSLDLQSGTMTHEHHTPSAGHSEHNGSSGTSGH
ncbi:putative aliphatic sulfonates transport permease protein SsuC [compost metagenome]